MSVDTALPKRSTSRSLVRDRLVQIGTEVLSEKSFETTGLEEILRRCDVPRGSFYYYFESKADFGLAVIDNYSALWEQKLTRVLRDAGVEPLQRIRNYIAEGMRGLEKYAFRRGCLIGNLGQELASLDDTFRTRIQSVFNIWTRYLEDCLEEARETGALSPDTDTKQIARFFWLAWEGAILQAKLDRSTRPVELFRDVFFNCILVRR